MDLAKFASKYFKVEGLKAPTVLTFSAFEQEEVGRDDEGKETKTVAYFVEDPRGLVLSTTHINQLGALFDTTETEELVGQKVELFVDPTVQFGSKRVGGIRFRRPGKEM